MISVNTFSENFIDLSHIACYYMEGKEDKMNEFAIRLRMLRKEKHLTQGMLSELSGCSPSLIAMYERGERKPSIENLEILADLFNVDTDFLLGKTKVRRNYDFSGVAEWGITSDEIALVVAYRNASDEIQNAIALLLHLDK